MCCSTCEHHLGGKKRNVWKFQACIRLWWILKLKCGSLGYFYIIWDFTFIRWCFDNQQTMNNKHTTVFVCESQLQQPAFQAGYHGNQHATAMCVCVCCAESPEQEATASVFIQNPITVIKHDTRINQFLNLLICFHRYCLLLLQTTWTNLHQMNRNKLKVTSLTSKNSEK